MECSTRAGDSLKRSTISTTIWSGKKYHPTADEGGGGGGGGGTVVISIKGEMKVFSFHLLKKKKKKEKKKHLP